MTTVDDVVHALPAPLTIEHRPWWRSRLLLSSLVVVGMLVGYYAAKGKYTWPAALEWNSLTAHLDSFQIWLSDQSNAASPSVFFQVVNGISSGLDSLVTWIYDLLTKLTWIGTTFVATLFAWRFGGMRAAGYMVWGLATFAAFGLWDESMQTLSLVLAAVSLSLAIGLPLGIVAGRSARFDRAITPALDAMQIIPAFAYLMPVVILFSVGPGAAVITTMIYSVPPAVRIGALGIRGVPTNTVEAAKALGSTGSQVLVKVQLPLARRMLLLAVNQTMLFALSMVVIAGLIGGSGLGDPVTNGLSTNPAFAILAGAAIVVMAIMLDRVTEAIADRTDPTHRHLDDAARRRARRTTIGVVVASLIAIGIGLGANAGHIYSWRTLQDWLLARIQSVLDYIADPSTFLFQHITNPLGNFLTQHLLLPLDTFLSETPWFVTVGGFVAIAFIVSGLRPALVTAAMLGLIGFIGEWQPAMDTASQVFVATAIAVALGICLGVWAAESDGVSRTLRPINDILQTLPQLVYVIPFVYLFPISYVPGLIASVLYAFPVVVRLVERGVRDVAPEAVEAAGAFGATRRQVLLKVKVPLARDAIMLGVNQGIIMVLAVVVIAGLGEHARARLRGGAGLAAQRIRARRGRIDRDSVPRHRTRSRDERNAEQPSGSRRRLMRTTHIDREDEMKVGFRKNRVRLGVLAVALAAVGVLVATSVATARNGASCGTVTLNEQAWAGSTANTYVAKYVLEHSLGCKVKITNIAEIPVYEALAHAKVDAVLEDWQHVDQYKQYATKQKSVVIDRDRTASTATSSGASPTTLMKQYPQFKTWKGLKGKETIFKTAESGSQGDVPGRRPVVRPEGQAADPGARAELQVRQRRRARPRRPPAGRSS